MERLTYGMVGGDLTSFIGNVHRQALALDQRARLVSGCFSRQGDKNAACGEAFGVDASRLYADWREMAEKEGARPDKIDFVSVCTPNYLHYKVCKAFIMAGINVVCEKPLCFEVEEAVELTRLAREKNLVFGVAYTYTGYTMVKVMREMISRGEIGRIAAINAEYAQDWLIDELSRSEETNSGIWRTDPRYTGISNSVGDIGTHMENLIHYLTGFEIKRLCATVNRYGKKLDYNDNILLEFTNGVTAGLWCSQIACGKLNGLKIGIYGTEGALEWEQHFPDYVKFTKRGEAPRTISRGCGYLDEKAASGSRLPAGHPEGFFVAFANIYRNIVSAILKRKNGETPAAYDLDFPTVEDGVAGVKFVLAVIESGDNGSKWVDLEW